MADYTVEQLVTFTFQSALRESRKAISIMRTGTFGGAGLSKRVFKMRGWYASGATWETWTSTSTPLLVPPSGHVLTDITIEAVQV
jgi:hypothetical protein